jgi:hypothetical protein
MNWYTFEAYDKMLFFWSQAMVNTFRERLGLTPLVSYEKPHGR